MDLKRAVIIILTTLISSGCSAKADEAIKAENNAYIHNNKGLLYLKEEYYYGAIKEFEIAIDLLPDSQASSAFYVNLGTAYEKIGYPKLAKPCFEKAVSIDVLCFDYYRKLAENYKKTGIIDEQIKIYNSKPSSPLNDVLIGLLYIQKGDMQTGIIILDDFCNKEPDLIITEGIKEYLKNITNEKM